MQVNDGGTASFSAAAVGDAPLAYQWYRDGKALSGATAATYITAALTLADSGSLFSVAVSNAVGTVTSSTAQLVVKANPPVLLTQPQSQTVTEGQPALFSIAAGGSPTLSFQWSRNGQPILGATSSTFQIAAADLADDGSRYAVKVSNGGGELSSSTAVLTVKPVALQITKSPASITVGDGDTATFQVAAVGSGALSYQWLLDGAPIAGATASSYSLPVSLADKGKRFSVTVTNPYGSATSDAAVLSVVASQPSPPRDMKTLTAKVGESLLASVAAGGTPPFSYQWQRSDDGGAGWRDIDGATDLNFKVSQATLAWAQVQLRVQVSNVAGTVASAPVLLKVSPNVRVLAGSAGGQGYADGVGPDARFTGPQQMALDRDGSILVADTTHCTIRRVAMDGRTSLAYGTGSCDHVDIDHPVMWPALSLAVNSEGRLFYATYDDISYVSDEGRFERLASLRYTSALTFDADGTLLAINQERSQLLRLDRNGQPSVVWDTRTTHPNAYIQLNGIALDAQRNIFVSAYNGIWRIDAKTGQVTRWVGQEVRSQGCSTEGGRLDVCQLSISSLRFDDRGNLVFLTNGNVFMRLDESGRVTRLSGLGSLINTDMDGPASVANFPGSFQSSLLWHSSGQFIVANYNGSIRTVSRDGTAATLAGQAAYVSDLTVYGKGAEAQFSVGTLVNAPQGFAWMLNSIYGSMSIDAQGVVGPGPSTLPRNVQLMTRHTDGYVYYFGTYPGSQASVLYRISPTGVKEQIAGGGSIGIQECAPGQAINVKFAHPDALITDAEGNVLIADSGCKPYRIWKVDLNTRKVERWTDTTDVVLQFAKDRQNNIAIAHKFGVAKLARDGTVTALAGDIFGRASYAFKDGFNATFKSIGAIAFDDDGNLYAADTERARIRRVSPNGYVTTVMGDGIEALRPGIDGSIGRPLSLIVTPGNRLLFTSENAVVTD